MGFTGSTATSNSSTALQMVNRVLLNVGQDIVSGFTTENRSQQTLDHINAAARRLFENEGAWDWLVRHDGVLNLQAPIESETGDAIDNVSFSDGVTRARVRNSSGVSSYVVDGVGAYFVYPGDSKWGNTAFKIEGAAEEVLSPFTFRLDAVWHTTISSSFTYDVIFPEYLLPPNVATITSARFQEEELDVQMLDADTSFNRWMPTPQQDRDEPRILAIGGQSVPTIEDNSDSTTLGTTPLPRLRLFVWPVPDDDYVINCSYRIKPTNLSATTDQLLGVPESAIDRIVEIATGTMMLQTHHADRNLAAGNLQLAQLNINKMRALHKPDAGRRRFMRSLDDLGRRSGRIIKRTWGSLDLDG